MIRKRMVVNTPSFFFSMTQLHQSFTNKVKRTVFENIAFSSSYYDFIIGVEAITKSPLTSRYDHTTGRCLWESDAVKISTNVAPTMRRADSVNLQLDIEGSRQVVDSVSAIISRYATYESSVKQDVAVLTDYKDKLNPTVWERTDEVYHLIDSVKDHLDAISAEFIEFLGLSSLNVSDVVITGSSANYNWTPKSDVDLHVVVDFDYAIDKYGTAFEELVDAKKTLWNQTRNVHIGKFPVELYVQDSAESHISTGVYSLKHSKWIIEPKHEKPEVDCRAVEAKVKALQREILHAISTYADPTAAKRTMDKIRKMRQSGLDKGGEFSTENLAFKTLRNDGYIDKLAKARSKSEDLLLSTGD